MCLLSVVTPFGAGFHRRIVSATPISERRQMLQRWVKFSQSEPMKNNIGALLAARILNAR